MGQHAACTRSEPDPHSGDVLRHPQDPNRVLDVSKTRRLLQHSASFKGRHVVLVLSGSFNPIHLSHVRCMDAAKTALEAKGDRVVGGWIAPSSEEYVRSKLGDAAMPLKTRCDLSRAAVADSDWISVLDWGIAYGERVRQHVSQVLAPYANSVNVKAFTALLVFGADYTVRARSWRSPEVCVGRAPSTDVVKKEIEAGAAHKDFVLVEADVGDFSSTSIRNAVETRNADLLLEMMHPSVVRLCYPWATPSAPSCSVLSSSSGKPLLIGICGPSGSGKSTVVKKLKKMLELGDTKVICISADSWLDPSKVTEHPEYGGNWENPDVVDVCGLHNALMQFKGLDVQKGGTIAYAAKRGSFRENFGPSSGKVVVLVEGYLLFHEPDVAVLFNTHIFLEAGDDTCCNRRFRREHRKASTTPGFEQWYKGLVWEAYRSNLVVQHRNTPNRKVVSAEGTEADMARQVFGLIEPLVK